MEAAGGFEEGVDLVDATNDFVVLGFERVVDVFVEEDCIDFVAGELAAIDDERNKDHQAEGPRNEYRRKYGHRTVFSLCIVLVRKIDDSQNDTAN